MGKPSTCHGVLPPPEFIGWLVVTRGSETSQYPQEEKTNSDSLSSGERKGMRLNHARVIAGGCCVCGVVGALLLGPPSGREVIKQQGSRTIWDGRP
jgi:hypothetical protein